MVVDMNDAGVPVEGPRGQGDVLTKLANLRKRVGVVKAEKKDGVKFKVRSADKLADKLRKAADEEGLLIYPVFAQGRGYPVEDGTLAEVNLTLRIQALSDGSFIDVMGFGLGADTQDKAGGKAGTYAWKACLIQTLLAGGAEDTDDTDTPIPGGVKAKGTRATPKLTVEAVRTELAQVQDEAGFKALAQKARVLTFEQQNSLVDDFKATRVRLGIASPAAKN
jgi:hypothetical protein